jgi:hypothetical protein
MLKQIFLPIIGVIIFIIAVGMYTQKSFILAPTTKPQVVTINDKKIEVTVAKTKDERTRGLSGVTKLDADNGMLFVFDTKVNSTFWMKDMLIPIDIIWISDGKIVKIDKNVPIPGPNTPDIKLPKYSSGQPIDHVLEVNAGFSDQNNLKPGQTISGL